MERLLTYTPATAPFNHQKEVILDSWDYEYFGWLMEMGTGKSKIGVDNMCMLIQMKGVKRVVIIAPKGTYANWYNKEIPQHMPELFKKICKIYMWRGGSSKAELTEQAKFLQNDGNVQILIMNIEAISASEKAWKLVDWFVGQGSCMVIVDESSTIKNPQAIRTKKVIKLGRKAEWRRILTGTPVTRNPLDLWAQFEFLAPACLGAKTFYGFRSRYAVLETKEFGGRKIEVPVAYRHLDELSNRVSDYACVIKKEDCLDLPPKVYVTRDVPLSDQQLRLYTEIKEWACAEIEAGRFISAPQVIVQLLRLHQIVCGHVVDENNVSSPVENNRLDVLMDIISETSGQNIIWCTYRRNIDDVFNRLVKEGRNPVRYDGGTSQEDRAIAINLFQEGKATDFVGTQAAGGYGITLTNANTVIYYSNNYDLEKRLQSEDRAHRIGQTKSVLYIDLVAKGTVDEKIIDALQKKQSLANLIMDGPARLRELFN